MSPLKEPWFFAARDLLCDPQRAQFLRYMERDPDGVRLFLADTRGRHGRHFVLEWDDYLQLFRDARDAIAIGEATADYIWLPSAAEAIRSRVPDARLIFMLRHPAERLFSWYLLALWRHSHLRFDAWFSAAIRPGESYWPVVDGGRYATHLARFLALFPREQVRVYMYDDYHAQARTVLRDIFEFLGVDPNYSTDLSQRTNETIVPRFPRVYRLRRRIFKRTPLTHWLPEGARRAFRRLYDRPRRDFAMNPEDRRTVIDYYRDEVVRTGDLIGRDLSGWLR